MPDSTPETTSAPRSRALRAVDTSLEKRRRAYEQEVRRFVSAGFVLVQRSGKLEPTVGDIVAEAGLSNQAFYKHFRSKDELLLAMLEEGISLLRSYIEHRVASGTTCTEKVRNWIEGILEQALSQQGSVATRPFVISRARLSERFPNEVQEAEATLTALLVEVIANGVQSGELDERDCERDALLLYNLAMGWVERQLLGENSARREDADHLVAFALHGLRNDGTRT